MHRRRFFFCYCSVRLALIKHMLVNTLRLFIVVILFIDVADGYRLIPNIIAVLQVLFCKIVVLV